MCWVVTGGVFISAVVPLSSHFRVQGLKRVANASLAARAAWTACASVQVPNHCLPSMRLPFGAAVTYPVGTFPASASDLAGVQASLVIQLPVPVLHHGVLAVCQKRMSLSGLGSVASIEAVRASFFAVCTADDPRIPLMPILTLPCYNLVAADCVVMCCAFVLVTEFSSYSRVFGSKRVVLADIVIVTVRT